MTRNRYRTIENKLFILLFVLGAQLFFAMDLKKGTLLSPKKNAWNLILTHTYPAAFDHPTICNFAQTCKQHRKYVLEKANSVKKSLECSSMRSDSENIQRLWHKYGSAYYETRNITVFNGITLQLQYCDSGKSNNRKVEFTTLKKQIHIMPPCIGTDGIYRYHVLEHNYGLERNASEKIVAYDINNNRMQCFGRRMDKNGQSRDFDLVLLRDTPSILQRILQCPVETKAAKVIYDCTNIEMPAAITNQYGI